MKKDIYMSDTGSLFLNGFLTQVENTNEESQLLRNRIKIKKGEIFYNKEVGFDWMFLLRSNIKIQKNLIASEVSNLANDLDISVSKMTFRENKGVYMISIEMANGSTLQVSEVANQ